MKAQMILHELYEMGLDDNALLGLPACGNLIWKCAKSGQINSKLHSPSLSLCWLWLFLFSIPIAKVLRSTPVFQEKSGFRYKT